MFETSQDYEARAYMFQGLKSEERKYRIRNFNRRQGNRFFVQSLEQGGRKWVISSYGSRKEEKVLVPSPSAHSSYKETPVVSSGNKRKTSGSRLQIPMTEARSQFDWERREMAIHMPNNIRNISQGSVNAHWAMGSNLGGSAILSDADTRIIAEDSAIALSSPRVAKGQETPILPPFSYHEEKAAGSASGTRKPKSTEQLERRKERRRRAQQVRRMIKSDKQNPEPQPGVFMQWEKSEVRSLLHRQELTLQSAHQAKLQEQEFTLKSAHQAELQKQERTLRWAHQAELQEQRFELKSAHQVELQKQWLELNSAHEVELDWQWLELNLAQEHREKIDSILWAWGRRKGDEPDSFRPAPHHIRKALWLLEQADDGVLWALEDLVTMSKERDVDWKEVEDPEVEMNWDFVKRL